MHVEWNDFAVLRYGECVVEKTLSNETAWECWLILVKRYQIVRLCWVWDGVEAPNVSIGNNGRTVILQFISGQPLSKELLV